MKHRDRIIKSKYKILAPHLNEKSRRLFAAVEASSIGYGGVSVVARVTKISRRAIHQGLREITEKNKQSSFTRKPLYLNYGVFFKRLFSVLQGARGQQ
jgi:hypothetical protein